MKKLTVKKNSECMACLQCVQACSEAFYKDFDEDLSCIRITAGKNGAAKPMICIPEIKRNNAALIQQSEFF